MDWSPRVIGGSFGRTVMRVHGMIIPGCPEASFSPNTVYVNPAHPNASDDTPKISNSPTQPWATIGRAAWGSTDRDNPDAGEAVDAGERVLIAPGTYDFADFINDRFEVVYNPVNEGSPGNYLTFIATGEVIFTAPSANSPIVGSTGRDYVKWYANRRDGNVWTILCDGRDSGAASTGIPNDDTKASNVCNPRPDTGPVVLHGCVGCWLEGFDIDGGPQLDYEDNYDGVRVEDSDQFIIRNFTIRNFNNSGNTGNGTGVKMYYSANGLVEHITVTDCGSGFAFKDTPSSVRVSENNTVRYCWVSRSNDGIGNGVSYSLTAQGGNFIYQNVFKGLNIAFSVVGVNIVNEWFFCNTVYDCADGTYCKPNHSGGNLDVGNRVWGNIMCTTNRCLEYEAQTQPAGTAIDHQHNLYQLLSGQFYAGSDGNRDFAGFNAQYTDQNNVDPDSIVDDPEFTDADNEDFTLGPSSPARNLARHPDTNEVMHAGAYQTMLEEIGAQL